MEQAKALNALEPFLALASSATSPRAAADLVVRATSAPNTYIFTELLQTPQIQALSSSGEFAQYLAVLQIFNHGTYESYKTTQGLPELTDAQRVKLRQLSLLTIASQKSDPAVSTEPALSYASLQKALDLPSRQALEELVISAIYAGLLKAQLNPKASLVQINSVSSLRDVAPTAIDGLLSSLQAWSDRCDATLTSLSAQMNQLRADANRRAAQSAAWAEKTEKLMEDEKKGAGGSGKGQGHPSSSIPFYSPTQDSPYRPSPSSSRRYIETPSTSFSAANTSLLLPNMGSTDNNDILTGISGSRVPPAISDDIRAGGASGSTVQATLMKGSQALKRDSGQMDADDDYDDNSHNRERLAAVRLISNQQTTEPSGNGSEEQLYGSQG
ncbi:hypothetical protein QBC42DRAFT_266466 [Cladorrhinum samala]|uniref:PCI domain-containing protein n=1 Tax=Cladorrhinum samala TaxID=585594 RepID=A0AAV9HSU1_9PEZI|nr:hypothetical protein QBC42DRAFT_266466 [Cladorrhinum samala]